jgi:hypothetical protein
VRLFLAAFIAILATVCSARADTPADAPSAVPQAQARTMSDEQLKLIGDAAQGGDAAAQGHLGALYAMGVDVPQNYGHAYFLLVLAKINGDETYEDIRKDILKYLTTDTAKAISQRAHEWKPGMTVNITQEGEAAPIIVLPPEDSWFTKMKKRAKQMYFNYTVDY